MIALFLSALAVAIALSLIEMARQPWAYSPYQGTEMLDDHDDPPSLRGDPGDPPSLR